MLDIHNRPRQSTGSFSRLLACDRSAGGGCRRHRPGKRRLGSHPDPTRREQPGQPQHFARIDGLRQRLVAVGDHQHLTGSCSESDGQPHGNIPLCQARAREHRIALRIPRWPDATARDRPPGTMRARHDQARTIVILASRRSAFRAFGQRVGHSAVCDGPSVPVMGRCCPDARSVAASNTQPRAA